LQQEEKKGFPVSIVKKNSQKYICYIPQVEETVATFDLREDKIPEIDDLLKPLETNCLYRVI
jgi:hypothetical protein